VAFWSGEKLIEALETLQLVEPYDPDNVDCSAYTLTMGPEYFISPDHSAHVSEIKKRRLRSFEPFVLGQRANPGEEFVIPPGQFAYLLTEEVVKIPASAMGFISLKFGVKGPGLINVSGFHVDPGYWGRLVFSVYNAGPSEARLQRYQQVFLLWVADLDRVSDRKKSYSGAQNLAISDAMVSKADRPVHSMQQLSEAIEKLTQQVELMKATGYVVGIILPAIVSVAGVIVALWALK